MWLYTCDKCIRKRRKDCYLSSINWSLTLFLPFSPKISIWYYNAINFSMRTMQILTGNGPRKFQTSHSYLWNIPQLMPKAKCPDFIMQLIVFMQREGDIKNVSQNRNFQYLFIWYTSLTTLKHHIKMCRLLIKL